jgi:hypothetical protein
LNQAVLFFTFFSNKVDLSTNKLKQAILTFPDVGWAGCKLEQVACVLLDHQMDADDQQL